MAKFTLDNHTSFYKQLKQEVDEYFLERRKIKANCKLYLKSVVLLALAIIFYFIRPLFPLNSISVILFGMVLNFLLECIRSNVLHDANNYSYPILKKVPDSAFPTLKKAPILYFMQLKLLGKKSFWEIKISIILC